MPIWLALNSDELTWFGFGAWELISQAGVSSSSAIRKEPDAHWRTVRSDEDHNVE